MYNCKDCGKEFLYPKKTAERHGLKSPPYEEIRLCPFCNSGNFEREEASYCRYCGARVKKGTEYCSAACEKKGREAWARQALKKEKYIHDPLVIAVREVEEYNKRTGKRLSYGEYFSGKR